MDLQVRAGGGALLASACMLVAVVAALRAAHEARPNIAEFCLAFVAVCAASIGAAMLCEGRKLFQEAHGPRTRPPADPRRERAAARR